MRAIRHHGESVRVNATGGAAAAAAGQVVRA
jgi:hypothetical protein